MRSPRCSVVLAFACALLIPVAAAADENLVAKREACHAEALARFKPKGRVTADLLKAVVAKRLDYVRGCMEGKVAATRRAAS